ncbi:VOC family protein [Chryseobacterium polytrichastri]|uniref:Lactoylglutathione lyase n=1 Tax=Chryseobacterium polytrichastri TaxID=1302687 RepID=A0A1M6Y6B9_9FLAO|nr:VOC family protein [Chryseobacterium polytrichastri]SHL13525.1 lactoylglutathione lyase [Chryseobacterium polytrichastri]
MKIEHIAIWCNDLELTRNFYMNYFNMKSNEKYVNPTKHYTSYFLSSLSEDTSARLELMQRPDILENSNKRGMVMGLAHLAISLGSKEEVDVLTNRLRADGYTIIGEPRTTGDGYYESVIEDPEGNWVELTE